MRATPHDLEREHGLRALTAHASAAEPDERLEMIFLRAEVALSEVKDRKESNV